MNKRVMSMLSAGVMAASTLLSSVPAFAANHTGSGYALVNIPYSVFYAGQGSNIEVDAVTTATAKINSKSLASGGYADADNNIKGVTLPVYVSDLSQLKGTEIEAGDTLDVEWTARGQKNTDTLKGSEVLAKSGDYAYYILDAEPSTYATLTISGGTYSVSALKGTNSSATVNAKIQDGETNHTDYEISGTTAEDGSVKVYGAVLNTVSGKGYGLKHISDIWRNGLEYGFDEESFSDIAGEEIRGITLFTSNGVKNITFSNDLEVRAYPTATVYSEDESAVYIKNLPSDMENVSVSVYVKEGRNKNYLVEKAAIVDGKVTLPDGTVLAEDTEYYVAIYSDNYPTKTATMTFPTAEPVDPVTPSTNKAANKTSSKHTHTYEWETTKAATATTDGVMKYRCTACGAVEYEVPISAYYVFNKDTQEAIKKAAAGATVKVETPVFISFHEMVKEALTERSDVTLVVDYKNAGKSYEMTIPAGSGATLDTLYGESQYAGFLYLGGAFATVEQ